MTVLDKLIAKGVEQGRAARMRRERKLIEQLIILRFGPRVDDALRARLDSLDLPRIIAINERLLDRDFEPHDLNALLRDT